MAVCGALCVNYVFYMQCQPIETNEMPRLSSLRGPRSLLFSFFFFFQRKTHLCIKFVHSDSFSSLSLQEFTDFFLSAYVVTIIIVSYIEAMIVILSLSCSKTAKKLTRNEQGRGLNGCEQARCTSGYTVGYVVEF